MELLLPLLLLVTTCAAKPRDMSDKMFTFPEETKKAHVKLMTSKRAFRSFTVCHRSYTDLQRDHSFFSMATPSYDNGILTFWNYKNKDMMSYVNDKSVSYPGLDYKVNQWHSVCTTWNSKSGLVQMWFDGQPLISKYLNSGSSVKGPSTIVLGQDQDKQGGGFKSKQSFVGMMTDVHMWDYVLPPCEIRKYMKERNFTPGNVLNWRALKFQIVDRVLIQDKKIVCVSKSPMPPSI